MLRDSRLAVCTFAHRHIRQGEWPEKTRDMRGTAQNPWYDGGKIAASRDACE